MKEMRSVYLYPWDALDAGIPALLDKLLARGLNGVRVACVYHGGKLLLAGNPRRRVYVPEDGAMYFRPSARFRRESPLRPPVSRLCQRQDPLAALCEQAHRRSLEAGAWVVCLHNRALANADSSVRVVNCFGDAYPHALCPLQSRVQQYLHALVDDLGRYGLERITLEALFWVPYQHYSLLEIEGVQVGPAENLLLSLCFCTACRKRFALLDEMCPLVRSRLEEFFRNGRQQSEGELDEQLPLLGKLLQERTEAITQLAGVLSEAVRKNGTKFGVIGWPPLRNPLLGTDLSQMRRHLDVLELAYYQASTEPLAAHLAEARRALGPDCRIELLLRPSWPDTPNFANLARKVAAARKAKLSGLGFYNYGILPETSLGWVQKALATGGRGRAG